MIFSGPPSDSEPSNLTRKSESLKARAAPRAERHWQPRRLCTPGPRHSAAVTVGGPAGPIGRLGL